MEGLITNYYEYHFLYISGIHHVESKNVQGVALMKLYFHPGTDMAQAMAETVSYVNRARAFMPPGTVARSSCASTPAACRSATWCCPARPRRIGEIQDQALFKVRPDVRQPAGRVGAAAVRRQPAHRSSSASIPTGCAPTTLSPDDVVAALSLGNTISPSGNVRIQDQMPIVPINAMVKDPKELGNIPLRPGENVYLRDVATHRGQHRHPHRLRPGQRPAGRLHPGHQAGRRLDAERGQRGPKPTCRKMQGASCPRTSTSASSSTSRPTSREPCGASASKGCSAPCLTGLMVLLFLRDWRSVLVVVLNIPLSPCWASVVALWLTGQTINLMTLGGLALAVGILVDEATVEVENIHTQLEQHRSTSPGRCGWATRRPPCRACWPCSASWRCSSRRSSWKGRPGPCSCRCRWRSASRWSPRYLLSSTFVPVLSVWLLRHYHPARRTTSRRAGFPSPGFRAGYARAAAMPSCRFAGCWSARYLRRRRRW